MDRTYVAIDLKSFYASAECAARKLDPLTTNLVVADESRTEKTICLAVSPSLKKYGIPGRARLFEVLQKVKEVNRQRLNRAPGHRFTGKSTCSVELEDDPALELDLLIAKPRMAYYMRLSTEIYGIYLKYVSSEDVHVYSIDEVFIDVTRYLKTYHMTARELTMTMVQDVLHTTGITATAGIGTNLYLSKIAMDIVAKKIPADKDGVRIAELDEMTYRTQLWSHQPITDFWRVGPGIARKLAEYRMYTMGDVCRRSVQNEELLYRLFGINAELLIDHAWGWEPCTIQAIKAYRPESNSLSSGQVLSCPYEAEKGKLIVQEMTDQLVLELVEKKLVADQMVLTVCYDTQNLKEPARMSFYHGPLEADRYGRQAPKPAHGSVNLGKFTSSTRLIMQAVSDLYDRIVDSHLLVRRMYVVANHVLREEDAPREADQPLQLDLFTDYAALEIQQTEDHAALEKERRLQDAMISIKKRYGKNAILKGMNFEEGATARERNEQVGGHKA